MRCVFLDIDGVIATDRTYKPWRKAKCPQTFEWHVRLIDAGILAGIDALAREAGAGIVVSSSWRETAYEGRSVDDVLRTAGLTAPVLGHTPQLPKAADTWSQLRHRGFEISAYVAAHDLALSDFVVLDDDVGATGAPKDARVKHGSRVILTPESTGCSPRHLARARALFALHAVHT